MKGRPSRAITSSSMHSFKKPNRDLNADQENLKGMTKNMDNLGFPRHPDSPL